MGFCVRNALRLVFAQQNLSRFIFGFVGSFSNQFYQPDLIAFLTNKHGLLQYQSIAHAMALIQRLVFLGILAY